MSPGGLLSAGTGACPAALWPVPTAGAGAMVLAPPPATAGDAGPLQPASAAASRTAARAVPGSTMSEQLLCDMTRLYSHLDEVKMNPLRARSRGPGSGGRASAGDRGGSQREGHPQPGPAGYILRSRRAAMCL